MDSRSWQREGEDVLRALPHPTREEDAALSLELARENAEGAEEDDSPLCEWCCEVVPDGESLRAPFCSWECEQEARQARPLEPADFFRPDGPFATEAELRAAKAADGRAR